jgi:hypothetical protein
MAVATDWKQLSEDAKNEFIGKNHGNKGDGLLCNISEVCTMSRTQQVLADIALKVQGRHRIQSKPAQTPQDTHERARVRFHRQVAV